MMMMTKNLKEWYDNRCAFYGRREMVEMLALSRVEEAVICLATIRAAVVVVDRVERLARYFEDGG